MRYSLAVDVRRPVITSPARYVLPEPTSIGDRYATVLVKDHANDAICLKAREAQTRMDIGVLIGVEVLTVELPRACR